MLCSSQWYHHTRSPKIPCIALPSPQTSSQQPCLPIHQGTRDSLTDPSDSVLSHIFFHDSACTFILLSCSLAFSLFSSTLSSRFVAPPTGSSSRYLGQNSPVPSPYTPQSPAPGYIQQFPHQPPSYNQHQQIQQGKKMCFMLPKGFTLTSKGQHLSLSDGQIIKQSTYLCFSKCTCLCIVCSM